MEEESTLCKIKLSTKINRKVPAFVIDFSNGRLDGTKSSSVEFKCFKANEDEEVVNNDARRILVANNRRLNYSSSSFDTDSYQRNVPLRYFVGVRSKSKMKLYDCAFFHLKPVQKMKIDFDTPEPAKTYRESIGDLTASFGSKNRKRALAARSKYAVDTLPFNDSLQELSLKEPLVTNTSLNVSADNSVNIDYIPTQNREATKVQDIFSVNDIITKEELLYITEDAELLANATEANIKHWNNESTYCKYVLYHLENDSVDLEKAKYLVYYNYMILFHRLGYSEIRKRDPAPHISEPIKSELLNKFTMVSNVDSGRVSRSLPPKMKDKLLAYIVTLALFIDNFCVNIPLVQSDLKIGITKVASISMALGCHIISRKVRDSMIKFAELKFPLFNLRSKYSKKY